MQNGKTRAEIRKKVGAIKRKADSRIPAKEKREPIVLDPNGAVTSILGLALQADSTRIALGAFCEGRQLKGPWSVRITSAELVPVE